MYLSEDRIDKGLFPYAPGSQCAMIHNDHLGTPQKLTDSTGAVVWSADYKPFGEATITVSTITNNLRFPGQYFDAETGTLYNYFRDYNPIIGRYIESDPIGLAGGDVNLYSYVWQDPINWLDPEGLKGKSGSAGRSRASSRKVARKRTHTQPDPADTENSRLDESFQQLLDEFPDADFVPQKKEICIEKKCPWDDDDKKGCVIRSPKPQKYYWTDPYRMDGVEPGCVCLKMESTLIFY